MKKLQRKSFSLFFLFLIRIGRGALSRKHPYTFPNSKIKTQKNLIIY